MHLFIVILSLIFISTTNIYIYIYLQPFASQMQHFHRTFAWLDAWSKTNQERYPRVCGAIASLGVAVEEEVSTQFWSRKPDRCRKRRRASPATDGSATGQPSGGQGQPSGGHAQPRRRNLVPADRRITTLQCQLWRKKKKIEELEQEIAKYKRPKDIQGRVSEEWIVRVILTAPNVSARALSESFRLTVGRPRTMLEH